MVVIEKNFQSVNSPKGGAEFALSFIFTFNFIFQLFDWRRIVNNWQAALDDIRLASSLD